MKAYEMTMLEARRLFRSGLDTVAIAAEFSTWNIGPWSESDVWNLFSRFDHIEKLETWAHGLRVMQPVR